MKNKPKPKSADPLTSILQQGTRWKNSAAVRAWCRAMLTAPSVDLSHRDLERERAQAGGQREDLDQAQAAVAELPASGQGERKGVGA